MIRRLLLCRSEGTDPYANLALEELLLDRAEDACILYLWQNRCTVVIGRNQNPWLECRTSLLEEEGGLLARRISGGGAVYHDLGNLNFTFLLPSGDYDSLRQTEVIRQACLALGIPAERSGRNDLLAAGRKFSGSAYYHHLGRSFHHGTLLVDADLEKLSRYLQPSAGKLRAKGVESVRSRVGNLRELSPGLSVDLLKEALARSFRDVYGLPQEELDPAELEGPRLSELTALRRSWEWNFGQRLPFDLDCQGRFDWGEIRAELSLESGLIRDVRIWTDAMDADLSPRLEAALRGCRLEPEDLSLRLHGADAEKGADLCRLLEDQL